MPSRKKAKGKARKAAKETKAEEEESRAAVGAETNQLQQRSLEMQMQRLIINVALSKMCKHGWPSLSADEKICQDFINAYIDAFLSQDDLGGSFDTAHQATIDEYADVYTSKLDTVISILLANGTQLILGRGNHDKAKLYASMASYFEEIVAVGFRGGEAIVSLAKPAELFGADDHTLVSFYRKRIPCACLDKKYEEVKSVKKMGLCCNPNCSRPENRVERSKMFCCTRCGEANYCSVECQKDDWKEHKEECKKVRRRSLNSNRKNRDVPLMDES